MTAGPEEKSESLGAEMIHPKFKLGDSVRVVNPPDAIEVIVQSLTPSGELNWLCEFYDGEIEAAS